MLSMPFLCGVEQVMSIVDGKYLSFNICKTPSAKYIIEYSHCCLQGVGFQVIGLDRLFQSRPSEMRKSSTLN